MKGLSLWQPWASLVAVGAKKFETRGWSTNYRGLIAIHAAKFWPIGHLELASKQPFFGRLTAGGVDALKNIPLGGFVAVAELTAVCSTEDVLPELLKVDLAEVSFGDYSPGRFAWRLENVRQIKPAVIWPGKQGLFKLNPYLIQELEEALR